MAPPHKTKYYCSWKTPQTAVLAIVKVMLHPTIIKSNVLFIITSLFPSIYNLLAYKFSIVQIQMHCTCMINFGRGVKSKNTVDRR